MNTVICVKYLTYRLALAASNKCQLLLLLLLLFCSQFIWSFYVCVFFAIKWINSTNGHLAPATVRIWIWRSREK